jgi:hypothetical protein
MWRTHWRLNRIQSIEDGIFALGHGYPKNRIDTGAEQADVPLSAFLRRSKPDAGRPKRGLRKKRNSFIYSQFTMAKPSTRNKPGALFIRPYASPLNRSAPQPTTPEVCLN